MAPIKTAKTNYKMLTTRVILSIEAHFSQLKNNKVMKTKTGGKKNNYFHYKLSPHNLNFKMIQLLI